MPLVRAPPGGGDAGVGEEGEEGSLQFRVTLFLEFSLLLQILPPALSALSRSDTFMTSFFIKIEQRSLIFYKTTTAVLFSFILLNPDILVCQHK